MAPIIADYPVRRFEVVVEVTTVERREITVCVDRTAAFDTESLRRFLVRTAAENGIVLSRLPHVSLLKVNELEPR